MSKVDRWLTGVIVGLFGVLICLSAYGVWKAYHKPKPDFTDAVAELHGRTTECQVAQEKTIRAQEHLTLAIHAETEAWRKLGEVLERLREGVVEK